MTEQNQQSALLGKITAYTEILIKDPRSTIFVSLGETYRKLGLFEDARRVIDKGLTLHPDFASAHVVLGRVLCQLRNFSGSRTAFSRALELDPESLAALVGYARVNILLGKLDQARDLLLQARQMSPADPVINKLLLSLEQEEDAKVSADEIMPDDAADGDEESVPLASSTLAELYLRQGLKKQALNVYRHLCHLHPDDLTLRRMLKELERELSDAEGQPSEVRQSEDPLPVDDNVVGDEPETETEIHPRAGIQDSQSNPLPSSAPEGPTPDEQDSERVLDRLNQWLSAIQQRREHV